MHTCYASHMHTSCFASHAVSLQRNSSYAIFFVQEAARHFPLSFIHHGRVSFLQNTEQRVNREDKTLSSDILPLGFVSLMEPTRRNVAAHCLVYPVRSLLCVLSKVFSLYVLFLKVLLVLILASFVPSEFFSAGRWLTSSPHPTSGSLLYTVLVS